MKEDKVKKIGIMGGNTTWGLGPIKDIILFFDCLNYFVVPRFTARDWSLLTDRFYRRYLRREELEPARELVEEIKKIFSTLASDEVDWIEEIQGDRDKTWLDARLPTLDLVFFKYFSSFDKAVDSAINNFDEYGDYNPVRLTISNGIIPMLEEMRPLEQYDMLRSTDEPFWMRREDEIFGFMEK